MPRPDSLIVRVLLTALVAFGPLSTDLYLPSLPRLVGLFGSDTATVQLTLSVFLAGFAVAQLVYGPLSDRFGRRPALFVGIAVFTLGSLLCALADSVEALIAARFVQALGACCGPVIGRAVVRDVFERDRAAAMLAYMAMAMALAPAVGPVIGGVLTQAFGWRANFILLTLFGVTMFAATLLLLGETNRHRDPEALNPRQLLTNHVRLFGDRIYLGYVLTVAFAYSGIFAFISGSSFVMVDGLGLSPVVYGLSFGVAVLGYMTGSFLAGRLTRAVGLERMIGRGTVVMVLAGVVGLVLALGGVAHAAAVVVPVFLYLVGCGLVLPNAMAGAVGPYPTLAGLASALLGFVQMTMAAGVGALVGHAPHGAAVAMMGAIAGVGLLAATVFRLLVARRR